MNEELNEKMKELEKEYASRFKELTDIFLEKIEKIKEEFEKKEKTFLKTGDIYYFINQFNNVRSKYYGNNKSDRKLLKIGNVFKTKEEAMFEVERMNVLGELKKFSCKFRNGESNHYIFLNCNTNELGIVVSDSFVSLSIYFESNAKAKEAIETVGEDRIKKYLFEVEE